MTDEPRYVNTDFEDVDRSIEGANLLWPETCKDVMRAAGRKNLHFKTDAEESRWRHVEQLLEDDVITPDWIKHRCEQAEKYRWGFVSLMRNILNTAAYDDWVAQSKHRRAPWQR